jgi:serine/threonine protein phosphatase PrpC
VSPPDSAGQRGPGAAVPGPTVSFSFNLAKVPDQGEDSDPILRDGPNLGLLAVFDGMGGAGGTVYDTPDGRRTGAYLASRVARDVVERRMLDLLEPDWHLDGAAAAEDIRRSVHDALVERFADLKAPPSGLRSRLLRALPTTMALTALQRTEPGGAAWSCHVLWAGDSRAYLFEPAGARQLTTDDIRDAGDAMANLRQDSVVSNAMSADTEFRVNHRKVRLRAPFFVACATDGCFGYVPTPMHFERLVLRALVQAGSATAWSARVQSEIAAVAGDDAAMCLLAVGAGFDELKALYAPRLDELDRQFTGPLDELAERVQRAEVQLDSLRREQAAATAERWHRYKPSYERHLQGDSEVDVALPDLGEGRLPGRGDANPGTRPQSATDGPVTTSSPTTSRSPTTPSEERP